jgi:hypothetical protein
VAAGNSKTKSKYYIGVSIGDSEDISSEGMSMLHLQDITVEIARYLLASGYRIIYGGDIRYDKEFNFAELLKDISLTYRSDYKDKSVMIENYVAFPLYKKLDASLKAKLSEVVKFVEVKPPSALKIKAENYIQVLNRETKMDRYFFAECLTEMRQKMNTRLDCRIIMGGKLEGFKGKYPGLVEEAYLAMKSGKPVFFMGAFGGCARAIIDALQGNYRKELTLEFQTKNQEYDDVVTINNERNENDKIDYNEIIHFFKSSGVKGLKNGLSVKENEELFTSVNIARIVSLVLKGLRTLQQ